MKEEKSIFEEDQWQEFERVGREFLTLSIDA